MITNTKLAEALRACMADIELWMETYKRQAGSLEVLDRAREALAAPVEQAAQAVPAGFKLAPHYRGYALLGTGRYLIDSTDAPADPELGAELIISIASEKDREGREIGERRDMPARTIQPDDMAVRIGFANERGLFALEDQLWTLRQEHWPGTKSAAMLAAAPAAPAPEAQAGDSGLKRFLALAEAAGIKSINDLPGLIPALQATEAQPAGQDEREAFFRWVDSLPLDDPDRPSTTLEFIAGEKAWRAALAQRPQAAPAPAPARQAQAAGQELDDDEADPIVLWAEIWRLRAAVQGPDGYATWQDAAVAERLRRARAEQELAQRQPLTADDLKEPKNGAAWRVEWWSESARLMLPAGSKLDSYQAYKNGTLAFTIKRATTGEQHG